MLSFGRTRCTRSVCGRRALLKQCGAGEAFYPPWYNFYRPAAAQPMEWGVARVMRARGCHSGLVPWDDVRTASPSWGSGGRTAETRAPGGGWGSQAAPWVSPLCAGEIIPGATAAAALPCRRASWGCRRVGGVDVEGPAAGCGTTAGAVDTTMPVETALPSCWCRARRARRPARLEPRRRCGGLLDATEGVCGHAAGLPGCAYTVYMLQRVMPLLVPPARAPRGLRGG